MQKKLLIASALSALAVFSTARADDVEDFTSVFTTPQAAVQPGTGSSYITFFADVKFGSSAPVDTWDEFPVAGSPASVMLDIEDDTGSPFTLSNAGFFLSSTEIPLDDLNSIDSPPSSYIPLPGFDEPVAGGSGISGQVVLPEPASIALLGLSGILAMRRRRVI